MNAFFSTPERITALAIAALRWRGTPWMANSAVCHVGLSCHLGPAVLLKESGFVIDVAKVPRAPSDWARHQAKSIMLDYLNGRPDLQSIFERTEKDQALPELQPGDILGFKCGLCVHHLGMVVPAFSGPQGEIKPNSFFQCMRPLGATVLSQKEREFRQRLAWAWRPLEVNHV